MVTPAKTTSPIDDFSQCHVGILSHLQSFAKLPALLEPAAQARRIAESTLSFFREAVYEHHAEEEKELFPAVLASANAGAERERVLAIIDKLTREHRQIEARWAKVEPELKAIAKGRDTSVDSAAINAIVESYKAHARFEEQEFLPLSQEILGRNHNHLAALGMSLHMRHKMPEINAIVGRHCI